MVRSGKDFVAWSCDECDGCDDSTAGREGIKNTVTIVTTVTEMGSPKSRKTFWGEEAQRNERALALARERAIWSLRRRFGGVQGGLFKGRPCRGAIRR